jgi:hypothetical protein
MPAMSETHKIQVLRQPKDELIKRVFIGGRIIAELKLPIYIRLIALPRFLSNQYGMVTPGINVIEPWPKYLSIK